MPYKLSGLTLNRVDLVPDGSNPDAHIVLFKSKEKKRMAKTAKRKVAKKPAAKKPDSRPKGKQRGEEDEEDEDEDVRMSREDDEEDEDVDDDAADEEDDEDVEKSDDEDEDEDDEDEADEDDEEDTAKSKRRKPAKKAAKKPAKKVAKRSRADDDEEDLADDDEDAIDDEDDDEDLEVEESVLKAMPKAFRSKFESFIEKTNQRMSRLQKRTARAAKTATIEKQKREKLEFVEKAKRVIPNLPGTNEEKGEMYQALYSDEPIPADIAKGIVKLLKAGDAAIASLMTETGRGRARTDEEADAISELREKAEELRKVHKTLSKEQAFEKACQENPDLFSQYKVEKRRATRDRDAH